MLHDGKAQSRAAQLFGAAFIDAVETLEDAPEVFRRYADPRVRDAERRAAALVSDAHGHASALAVVFDRVVAEVEDDAAQKPRDAADHGRFAAQRQRDASAPRFVPQRAQRFLGEGQQIHVLALHAGRAFVQKGKADDVVHQTDHAPRFLEDAGVEDRAIRVFHEAVRQKLRRTGDCLQRRFQFVGDVRRELAADPFGFLFLGDIERQQHRTRKFPAVRDGADEQLIAPARKVDRLLAASSRFGA